MKRERNTLVGTPVVIAPGAIFLVGEFGLPGEDVAVLAALTSHATAQYFPKAAPLSPLVAEVVERARTHLGDAAAALPPGSVLLGAANPPQDKEGIAFDTPAAVAIATTAAVFETAGQMIRERKEEILGVAEASYRAMHNGMGAEGELAAALHGGLIKVIHQPSVASIAAVADFAALADIAAIVDNADIAGMPDSPDNADTVITSANAAPRIETLPAPAGLHLVLFHTGQPLFPEGWLSDVRQFADHDRSVCAPRLRTLLEESGRFVAALSAGNATAAIAAAGRYGQCILELAAAASAPLQCEPFVRAAELAKEIGGIAKTTHAGHSDLGLAMFATPEAANLFTRACQPPIVPLAFDLERTGVHCLAVDQTGESAAVCTPAPVSGPFAISSEAIVRTHVVESTAELGLPDVEFVAASGPVVVEDEEPVTQIEAPSSALLTTDTAPRAPQSEASAAQPESLLRPARNRLWPGAMLGTGLVAAALLGVWLTRSMGHHSPAVPLKHETVQIAATLPPAPTQPMPPAPPAAPGVPAEAAVATVPTVAAVATVPAAVAPTPSAAPAGAAPAAGQASEAEQAPADAAKPSSAKPHKHSHRAHTPRPDKSRWQDSALTTNRDSAKGPSVHAESLTSEDF